MRTFDQIIFDELSAHNSVLLEDVGYLKIDNIPAMMMGKNTVSAPRNVVTYTHEAPQNVRNVINILESEGLDYNQARDQYYSWLVEARKDNALRIYSAGVLKDGIFMSTAELDKKLNPNSPAAIVVKRKNTVWMWILIIIVLLLGSFFGYRYWESNKTKQPEVVQQPVSTMPDTTATVVIPEQVVQTTEQEFNYPIAGRYYIVAGVFDIPENADKLIEKLKRQFPDLTLEKFDYPGTRTGRTMVTVYSSAKHSETLNMRRELAWTYDLHDYWIYPQN